MRLSIPAATLKRIKTLEQKRGIGKIGGYMLVPPMVSPQEWEVFAEPSQRALKLHVKSMDDAPPDYSDLPDCNVLIG